MIHSIELKEGLPPLVPFCWGGIPKLSIISGLNGSGKSQLLINIKNKLDQPQHYALTIGFSQKIKGDQVNFVNSYFMPGDIQAANTGNSSHEEEINKNFVDYARRAGGGNVLYNNVIQEIVDAAGKPLEEMTDDEIRYCIPTDLNLRRSNYRGNEFISEMFFRYQSKIDDYKIGKFGEDTRNITEEDIYQHLDHPPPWDVINELFDRYGFDFRIMRPRTKSAYGPLFYLVDNPTQRMGFGRLSDGEKIIATLILWSFNSWLGAHTKLFLLDEIDAHLNPSMSKILLHIIREKIIREFGIQVIMTTHSPSTVARARDSELFWMERGKAIRPSSRAEIIPILADGLITVTQDEAALRFSTELGDDDTPALCVEGITDKIILTKAWLRLFPDKEMPFRIFDMFGAAFIITQFQAGDIFDNYPGKQFIGLLDFDGAYIQANGKLKDTRWVRAEENSAVVFKKKDNKSCISTIVLPEFRTDYVTIDRKKCCHQIELMFPDNLVESYCDQEEFPGGGKVLRFRSAKKREFASLAIDKFNDTDFEPFRALFQHIMGLLR